MRGITPALESREKDHIPQTDQEGIGNTQDLDHVQDRDQELIGEEEQEQDQDLGVQSNGEKDQFHHLRFTLIGGLILRQQKLSC